MIARRLRIHGRVQGVFFRDSVRRQAQSHGLRGWARNCKDGTVEVHVEGEEEAVEALTRFCQQGPPRAEVERVEARDTEPQGLERFSTS